MTMKTTNFNVDSAIDISEAIRCILNGICKRVDVSNNIKVYSCGSNVIRIDLKVLEVEDK